MLAGRMKLKHFLALVSCVGIAGIVLLVKACKSSEPPPKPQDVVVTAKPPEPTPAPPAPDPKPTPPASNEMTARPYDADVIAWSKKSISGDKVKDASKGKLYKINLYKDPGKQTVNRAKVDVNRNDKFDEKYTFEDGKITLEVAPADDEKYTKTYHWTGTGWLPEGATPAPAERTPEQANAAKPPPPAEPIDPNNLRPRAWDAEVLAWKDKSIPGDKEKDVSKGMSYKINVYKDAGHANVNRAKVDLDRDDKFDEKYTFESGKITLQRAPQDDEQYTDTYHWTANGWAKQ